MSYTLRSRSFVKLSVYFTLIALGGLLIAGRTFVSATAQGGSPGSLDPSFANVGKLTDAFYRGGRALALQPDGKIVVGGYGDYSSHGQVGDFRLFRLNGDGSLDPTFDGDGRASATMGDFANLNDLLIQPDGKIVTAGKASTAGDADFAVARFNPDGSLDATFDGDGRLRLNFSEYDEASAVLLQPDGRIVLVGFFANGPHTGATYDFTVVRLNGDGSLDPSFGTGGRVITDFFGSGDRAFDAVLQPDGKIVAAGDSKVDARFLNYDFALARYNPNGTLDTTFDGDGKVTTPFIDGYEERAWRIALQPDGKLIAGGGVGNSAVYPVIPPDTAMARYNPDGSLDPTFDGDGKFVRDLSGNGESDDVRAIVVQSNGKIIIAGSHPNLAAGNHYDLALVRFLPNGQFDSGFGSGGKVLTDFGDVENPPEFGVAITGETSSQDLAIQPDGRIVASTQSIISRSRIDIGVARYLSDAPTPTDPIRVALSRDGGNNLRATVTITNPTAAAIPGVTVTLVRASTLDGTQFIDGTPVPQSFGSVNPGQSVAATVTFPGTSGVPAGFSGLVRVDLSYTGGTYTETERVTTP